MRETLITNEANHSRASASVDISIAQMLALAKLANIEFDVAQDRLLIRSAKANWKLWPPVRHYLDQIGVDAIVDYFKRTSAEHRTRLAAPADGIY
jgi:hypothetical protein